MRVAPCHPNAARLPAAASAQLQLPSCCMQAARPPARPPAAPASPAAALTQAEQAILGHEADVWEAPHVPQVGQVGGQPHQDAEGWQPVPEEQEVQQQLGADEVAQDLLGRDGVLLNQLCMGWWGNQAWGCSLWRAFCGRAITRLKACQPASSAERSRHTGDAIPLAGPPGRVEVVEACIGAKSGWCSRPSLLPSSGID